MAVEPNSVADQPDGGCGPQAPAFQLPGYRDGRARLFRLTDCLQGGAALLWFAPEISALPLPHPRDLEWFQLLDGVGVYHITNADPRHASAPRAARWRVPYLYDADGRVSAAFGVDYDPNGRGESTAFLVDHSGTVRVVWRDPEASELEHIATAAEAVASEITTDQ